MNNVKDAVPAPADAAKGKNKKKPDDTDHELEGLMSEIETDLREEEFKKIWKSYGALIITFVVAMIVGVAGFQFYRQVEAKRQDESASRYEAAVKADEDGKTDEALAQLNALAKDGAKGYATLARLTEAALQVRKNDIDAALANYKVIMDDTGVDPVFRDLATLLTVLHSIDRADAKTLEAQLTPLTNPNNAFNLSALELSALLAAKQGDTARAIKTLAQITADPGAPASMRERADDLTKLYESGVVPPPPPAPAMPAPMPAPTVTITPAAPAAPAAPPAAPAAPKP
ncbi:MAG: tetratricopeptide repeat protein [Rhodospirillaceae bacterium]|nr:tetratricopeptide repeat protein [Rhodospirillaceae bacterium]